MVTQEQIFNILQDLGGKAILKDIFKVAKERYNLSTYHKNACCSKLNDLYKWQRIDRYYDKSYKKGYTYVIKK